jgi:hypothetical protein
MSKAKFVEETPRKLRGEEAAKAKLRLVVQQTWLCLQGTKDTSETDATQQDTADAPQQDTSETAAPTDPQQDTAEQGMSETAAPTDPQQDTAEQQVQAPAEGAPG